MVPGPAFGLWSTVKGPACHRLVRPHGSCRAKGPGWKEANQSPEVFATAFREPTTVGDRSAISGLLGYEIGAISRRLSQGVPHHTEIEGRGLPPQTRPLPTASVLKQSLNAAADAATLRG